MRSIIGTAGHVDHGKTALIKALTGVTTARPEERKRGMTIDLGFAHFNDNDQPIGVIDVPGHERYIRNMVAGVWSLDMILLVIAADEGWMPMTTDHLRVAHAMGIRNMLLVINKSDTVDAETLQLVEDEALEKCLELTDQVPESIAVSALSGTNIDRLRSMIINHLRVGEPRVREDCSHLYIDRVFSVNGIGTVVTGSLAGDHIDVGDKLRLLPHGKDVQVKTLQSYHKNQERAESVSRVAVGLKGVGRKELERGHCLVARDSSCQVVKELLVRLDSYPENRRNREVEVALGTWHGLARITPISNTRFARVVLDAEVACFWGQPLVMIRHGGSDLLFGGQVIWAGSIPAYLRKRLYPLLEELPEQLGQSDHARLSLELYGYAPRNEATEELLGDDITAMGDWVMTQVYLDRECKRIQELLEKEGTSMMVEEICSKLYGRLEVITLLLEQLKEQGIARKSNGAWLLGAGNSVDDLPQIGQQIYTLAETAGSDGFEAEKVKIPGMQKELRNMVRLGFLVPMEGKIYYTHDVYMQLMQKVVAGCDVGDRFTIPEGRDKTGLSRKYLIPLLNRMEQDGWLKRDDNDRIVLRTETTDCVAAA